MDVRVIYRTCPACGRRFGQPDDPGRKRRYCSDACKQAAYRARKRASEQARQPKTTPAAAPARTPAGLATVHAALPRRTPGPAAPAPTAAHAAATAGRTPSTTTRPAHDRARRRYDGLSAKAASTGFPEEAAACRAKAEQLRAKYGL
jgi:hypothetical protein